MSKHQFPGFDASMAMMRKHDPQIQEEGFHCLLPCASQYVHDLIDEFHRDKDHGLRCWLLELVAEAKSPEAFPLLVEYLKSDDESFGHCAAFGLHKLDTKAARRVLWEARSYTFDSEEETKRFREMLDQVRQWK